MKNPFLIIFLMILIMFLGKETQAQSSSTENSQLDLLSTQKRNVIKVDLLAPLAEHLEFSYERAISPRTSLHLGIGLSGIDVFGKNSKVDLSYEDMEDEHLTIPSGFFIDAGYRFYLFELKDQHSPNILKGVYVEPNLLIGHYKENEVVRRATYQTEGVIKKENINYQALLLNGGYQAVLFERVTLDAFIGLGFGNDNKEKYDGSGWIYFGEFHQGLYKPDGGTTWALDLGFKVGFAF